MAQPRQGTQNLTYLDDGQQFEQAITAFSTRYAQQNQQDYQAFADAAASGRISQIAGV